MSLVRVMKGPVAKAGSIFNLLSNRGKAVPKIEANRITMNRERVTVNGMANELRLKQRVRRKIMEEQIVALISAPPISLMILWNPFLRLNEFEANPCTTMAED